MEFYDIHDQTKYEITISQPENMEDLSDLFVTKEELEDLVGKTVWFQGKGSKTITLHAVISAAVKRWAEKLEASGKKTLRIDDEELLVALKKGYLSDFLDADNTYGRHGDRICFARRYKRRKTKVTQGDVTRLWDHLVSGFQRKFTCWPPHIPRYDRHVTMFKAFKKIVGWQQVRAGMHDKDRVKFFRLIWDNPEEYIK